jgi:hypothetical protein
MYQTIRLSSCVSVHGEVVEALKNGEVVVRDGSTVYRGRPIGKVSRIAQRNYGDLGRSMHRGSLGVARA